VTLLGHLTGDPQRGARIAESIRTQLDAYAGLPRLPIALICVPPMVHHSTTRLLWTARAAGYAPELPYGDAVALDYQLAQLADLTAATDPWTAALTQTGADQ